MRTIRAGVAYFLIVFAAGFLLGTLRVLFVVPHLGETAAVAIEIPVMLAVSWIACGFVLRRWSVPQTFHDRFAMGGLALAILLIAEAALSLGLSGRTLAEHLALYRTIPVLIGLVGQIAFALMPVLRMEDAEGGGTA